MKGLTSSNAEESKSSLEKADEYLLNHGDGLSNPTVKKKKDGVTTTRTGQSVSYLIVLSRTFLSLM